MEKPAWGRRYHRRGHRDDLFHAIRADLLRRLGRTTEAAAAYDAAIARTDNAAEREFLQRQRQTLELA